MISIGVKSKYGSCSGNCTGLINVNNTPSLDVKNLLINCLKINLNRFYKENKMYLLFYSYNLKKISIIYIYIYIE
jgi:hypothetical protein